MSLDDLESCSIEQFCLTNGISRSSYYKLKKSGKAPREMNVGVRKLISKEARADWRREREAEALASQEPEAA